MGAMHMPVSANFAKGSPHALFSSMEFPVLRIVRPAALPAKVEIKKALASDTLLSQNASGAVVEKTVEQIELERLAGACRGGDTSAWQQLVTTQHRRVYGICYRFTGNATDAEDLTQDVFLKVYKNLETFDGTKGNFTTWLTTLTRNLLVDHFRRTRQDRVTDSMDASSDGEADGPTMVDRLADTGRTQHDNVAQMELRAQVQHALKQISPELREAVILRDLQDMDYKEIAQVLRVPEGTVKSRISRGRAELARLLQRTQERQVV
ncbi:MAG: RNA polymerase sigma factor [Acidobacteria bacterium]|nr:RNA polymerase sigma factor [Acidobacteriota bacterium]